MGIAENDDKVANIVTANLEHFRTLYAAPLEQPHIKQYVDYKESTKLYVQDASSNTLYHHLNYLPHNLISKIVNEYNRGEMASSKHFVLHKASTLLLYAHPLFPSFLIADGSHRDREEVMHILKEDFRLDRKVLRGLREIILDSSWKQTAKGVLTAGVKKSVFYAGQKLSKKWKPKGRAKNVDAT